MTESQAAYPAAGRDSLASETGSQPRQGVRPPTRDTMNRMADRTVQEPVEESAALARRKAAEFCDPGDSAEPGCALFHGLWQYFRIFGLASTPARNIGFFMGTLESLGRDGGFPRMLISGAADYSMPAHVLQAYRNVEAPLQLTVVDCCETPLHLCRWYAERMSETMDTCANDILDFAPQEPFDATCSHSFLARFSPQQRKTLMSAWHRILRPGGKVITNARLNPSAPPDGSGFSPDQVTAFRDRFYREAVKHRDALGIDPDEMAEQARQYAERWITHSVRTSQEIADLFEDGGFQLDRLDIVEVAGRPDAGKVGPSTDQKATYAEIVATRL